MDEDVGVRLTRLRRRLSVEQNEEVISSAPSTPTKKRLTKLAKPQLDDIVENTVVASPKRTTRRSVAPEAVAHLEERVATPGVRAARSRSNTSLLSESVQAVDSPRTKRAPRRNSLAGSDTESASANTPVRRSRRISKDFNKSSEILAVPKLPAKISKKRNSVKAKESITEESEGKGGIGDENVSVEGYVQSKECVGAEFDEISGSISQVIEKSSASEQSCLMNVRKSPRLSFKKISKLNSSQTELEENELIASEKINLLNESFKNDSALTTDKHHPVKKIKISSQNKINKSLPTILDNHEVSNKRSRTKSLTNFENKSSHDHSTYFFSDNESRQIKLFNKGKFNRPQETTIKGTGDHLGININESISKAINFEEQDNKENDVLKAKSDISLQVEERVRFHKKRSNSSVMSSNSAGVDKLDITTTEANSFNDENEKNISNSTQLLNVCESKETATIYSTIFMDDADMHKKPTENREPDSNRKLKHSRVRDTSSDKSVNDTTCHSGHNIIDVSCHVSFEVKNENDRKISNVSGDQKNKINVLVSENINVFAGNDDIIFDKTCEPMDIDQTIPENVNQVESELKTSSYDNTLQGSNKRKHSSNERKMFSIDDDEIISVECSHKLEKSYNASKSTLLLSVNNSSPKDSSNTITKQTKKETPKSKSFDQGMKKVSVDKKNLSSADVTIATPLRHKTLQNNGVFTSTPVPTPLIFQPKEYVVIPEHNKNKGSDIIKIKKSKNNNTNNSFSDESSSADAQDCSFIDGQAKDAGNDYESGDSQDEEDQKYSEENELPIGGESLESENNTESDDSEYEKDSFIVSSAAEDNELLTGSGDDLSLTDNELKMTSKSKKKYDTRKSKESKNASREMFESRHKKNNSSVLSDDSEDANIVILRKNKKINRLRLDSSKDLSDEKPVQDEAEMSLIGDHSFNGKDPLSVTLKQEVFEISSSNKTLLEPIENVEVNQDVTIFANNDDVNPLISFNKLNDKSESESSDDDGIAENYSSLLNDLNSSNKVSKAVAQKIDKALDKMGQKSNKKPNKSVTQEKNIKSPFKTHGPVASIEVGIRNDDIKVLANCNESRATDETKSFIKKTTLTKDLSFTEYRGSKIKEDNSLLDKLNITSSGKIKKGVNDGKQVMVHSDQVKSFKNHVSLLQQKDDVDVLSFNKSDKNKQKNTQEQDVLKPSLLEDSSSDSIDFKLLFTPDEDSYDAPIEINATSHAQQCDEKSFPLKKCEGKTNLLGSNMSSVKTGTSGVENSKTTSKKRMAKKPGDINLPKGNEEAKKLESNQTELKSRKRKDRDNDIPVTTNDSKVLKSNYDSKISVRRLPSSILEQLDEYPQKPSQVSTKNVTATSVFQVEPMKSRRTKPSLYLEESIHIDRMTAGPSHTQQGKKIKKPKLLKSIPIPSTSNVGFTTNFQVNLLKQEKRQDAKLTGPFGDFENFKAERLYGSTIKRIATEDLCRKQKRLKTTRF